MAVMPDWTTRRARVLVLAAAWAGWPRTFYAAQAGRALLEPGEAVTAAFALPLVQLLAVLAIAALLVVAVLKRRHRSELLAVCLALSIALHVISFIMLGVFTIKQAPAPVAPAAGRHRIETQSAVLRESRARQRIRAELLRPARDYQPARLAPKRPARQEPVPPPARAQAIPQAPDMRSAGRNPIKTPAILLPKPAMLESPAAVPDRPMDRPDLKPLSAPRQIQRAPEPKAAEPNRAMRSVDIGQAARPAAMPPSVTPAAPQAEPKTASSLPAPAPAPVNAAADRPAVGPDVIEPVKAGERMVRVDVPARPVHVARAAGRNTAVVSAGAGAPVGLERQAGAAQAEAMQRIPAAARPAAQPRMDSGSLASENPGGLKRKQNEVAEFGPGGLPGAPRLEPLRVVSSGVQPLAADARPDTTARHSAGSPAGQRAWLPAREQGPMPGAEAAGRKVTASIRDITRGQDPVRVGLGAAAMAERPTLSPAAPQGGGGVPVRQPGMPLPTDPAPAMAAVDARQQEAGSSGDRGGGPAELTAEKRRDEAGGMQIEAAHVAPRPMNGNQNVRLDSGTFVDPVGGGHPARALATAALPEQWAEAASGGDIPAGAGMAAMSVPVPAMTGIARGVSGKAGSEQALRPLVFEAGRTAAAAQPAQGGGVARPLPTERPSPESGQSSFVEPNVGLMASPAPGAAGPANEEVDAGDSFNPAGVDTRSLAGSMSMARRQGQGREGGGQSARTGGATKLLLEKAGGVEDSGPVAARVQAPDVVAGNPAVAGPAETGVVQPGPLEAGQATGPGGADTESLTALPAFGKDVDSVGLAMAAPAARSVEARQGGAAGTGVAPAAPLHVAKAGGPGPGQDAGGLGGAVAEIKGAGERAPARMDLNLGAAPAQKGMTSDIAVDSSRPAPRRSFLSVGTAPNSGAVPQKAIYKMRKPDKRRQFIKELGGTEQTETAVEQALAWLSRAQSDDGHWDIVNFKMVQDCGGAGDMANEDVGMTGLVLLAYLGAGYTHLDGEYQETVCKGLEWLLNIAKENGDIRGAGRMYGQAMATTALCESYSLTGDERLLAPTRRAVEFIVKAQAPESGWRFEQQNNSDTSVTGWQILALRSAQIAGFDVPEKTFQGTERWLDKVRQGADGGLYSFRPGHVVTPVMTAEGAFCHVFMDDRARARAHDESVALLMKNLPEWNPEKRLVHMYYWYYATLSLYLSGAHEFHAWNEALIKALQQGHRKSGPAAGSWDPVCLFGERGGRIYSTALGALCLEVYYRFLPLTRQGQL